MHRGKELPLPSVPQGRRVGHTHTSQPLQQMQVDIGLYVPSCTPCTSQGRNMIVQNILRWELARDWDIICSQSKQVVKQMVKQLDG